MLVLMSLSYAFFTGGIKGENSNSAIMSGNLDLRVSDSTMNITSLEPIYDDMANNFAYSHTFSIERGDNATLNGCYNVFLVIDKIGVNLRNKYLKYRITEGNNTVDGTFDSSNITYVDDAGVIKVFSNHELSSSSSLHSYNLKIWISYSDTEDQSFMLTGTDEDRTIKAHIEANGFVGSCPEAN